MSSGVIIQTMATKPKKKKSGWMRFLQAAIFLGIIAGIYVSFYGNVLSERPGVPALIAHFTLSHVETGDKALTEIRELYGEEITYAKSYLAHYKGESGGLTIRVGEKREVADAESAINSIVGSVQRGEKKGVTNLNRTDVEGREVYSFNVSGMPHFVYRSENKIIWVDIMEGNPSQVLPEIVRSYR